MAHPTRQKFFGHLREKLGVSDKDFSIDVNSEGVWFNCKRSWLMYDLKADWHIVVQDDAIVCDNFRNIAQKAIESAVEKYGKNVALSFYWGNRQQYKEKARQGLKQGHVTSQLHWGIAVCLPTRLIKEMIKFCDKMEMRQDDARIKRFLNSQRIKVYYPLPSLIDHRTGEDSLVGDPGRFRKALYFIDENSNNNQVSLPSK